MDDKVTEAGYPIAFRQEDATFLGKNLKEHNNVILIGMKRVGISNFLRFFLNHKDIARKYIADKSPHLFISVDLNDLVEREVFPFWILTLKRISDGVEKSTLNEDVKKYVERLFLDSMQSKDVFLTIENIKKSLAKIIEAKTYPAIFFVRFDRLKEVITPELFGNLQGLKDASGRKVPFVFTSFRRLTDLAPEIFTRSSLSLFVRDMYVKPAGKEDIKIIFNTYKARYGLIFPEALEASLFEIVDGYVQYLQLALISIHESGKKFTNKQEIFDFLSCDERIKLQSEELWESLTKAEQDILVKINKMQKISEGEKKAASYLWDSGFVGESSGKNEIFSPLFGYYLEQRQIAENNNAVIELSKKENTLFEYMKGRIGEICEREEIIQAVWAEVEEFGVSDWAIDRLIARLRVKLKAKKAKFEIQTVKTRGYKMIED